MKLQLPPILESKLADFRRSVWRVKLAEASLSACAGVAASYLIVFASDRLLETPGEMRTLLLLAGSATVVLGIPLKWYRWVWRQRRLEDAARLLKRTFPRLGDQLLGLVELARQPQGVAGRSERLIQAAMDQAAEAVKQRDFRSAVPEARHVQWACAAAGGVFLAALTGVWTPGGASNALARWLLPWRNIERFTFTRIEKLPDRWVIPFAEPFFLPVHLAPDTEHSPRAGSARIARQPVVTGSLNSGTYALAFPPQKESALLRLRFGDFRASLRLEPRHRPELSGLSVCVSLPAYLRYSKGLRMDVRGGSVGVLRGAEASFEARIPHPLASAHLDNQPLAIDADRVVTPFYAITGDRVHELMWKDLDGLSPREPLVLKIHAATDEAPRISARPETLEQVVLESDVLNFDVTTHDDYGIQTVGLEWNGMKTNGGAREELRGEKIAAAGAPEKRELSTRATFCAQREGVPPQTLEIRAWCTDYLPERPRVVSNSFLIHVLTKADHAAWIIGQLGKWQAAAVETYDREQQLHESNRELRRMSAEELDRPENRRRVAQQAAAEKTNAARLDSLTSAGRHLIEQATRNDEFDAARLETWAGLMRSLKDISAARMPSVANLLKQTASAETRARADLPQPPTASTPQGQPSQAQAPQPSPSQPPAPTPPVPPTPSVSDRESGFSPSPPTASNPSASPTSNRLSLPQTQLNAAPGGKKDTSPQEAESPAQEKLENAIEEQKDLLEEFAKVSDQLNKLLGSLETSTFVKRLKHASRKQMALAGSVSKTMLSSFGVPDAAAPDLETLGETASEQSEFVRVIQADLEAYAQRKQDESYSKLLEEMKKVQVVGRLANHRSRLLSNFSGQTLASAEFWADTLDRWAEELVSASQSKSGKKGPAESADSLPPEVILKVMKALHQEVQLRDQTRETEMARSALREEVYGKNAAALGERQEEVAGLVSEALSDIFQLPGAERQFSNEIRLLDRVVNVMRESRGLLLTPDTGSRPVAAETEAIELLLQAKRNSGGGGGGGGGGSPGGGATAGFASSTALQDIGSGEATAQLSNRPVGQSTGQTGKEFPAEFKAGLDAYFNLLEGGRR